VVKRTTLTGIALGVTMGLALGVGAYTFIYAKGASYLTNDPKACTNCHVMEEQYDGWLKSSHRSVATCNDCHTPHNLIGKYSTKAQNGFWHSFYFTTGKYPDPIQITERNRKVTEAACRHCHADIVQTIEGHGGKDDQTSCLRCHRSVGHLH
jgi:cytochrome c nitrite reductase small subunit